ncbi:unnamed protein product [Lymnaea stagnalis]|uniref:Dynein heavy chain AAA 5 extension domain-containing protein n=1 Tax=Lymnaea stagnalis TaxID=6523 RepID=A0AAV2HNK4_LYMST
MVYLGTSVLGIWPLIECWLRTVPPSIKVYNDALEKLFKTFLIPGLSFVRSNLTEIVGTMDTGLIFSLTKIIDCFISPLKLKVGGSKL